MNSEQSSATSALAEYSGSVTAQNMPGHGTQIGAGTSCINPSKAIRVLIVDDHDNIRWAMKEVLSAAFKGVIVGEAENGEQAMNAVAGKNWDIVLLDPAMRSKNGLDIIKQIKVAKPGLPILVVSGHTESRHAVQALKSGASDYLTKDAGILNIVPAVKKVLAGGKYNSGALA